MNFNRCLAASLLIVCCSAVAASNPDNDRTIISCAGARSGSVTAALVCADKAEAMRQLDEAGCFVKEAAANEVRSVWLVRESLSVNAAARDRTIQLLMASCLLEAHSKTRPPDSAEISATAYLRAALKDNDSHTAGIAIMSLWPVFTQDDINAIVKRASNDSAVVMPAVTALSMPCTVEAASGIARIQSVYAGSPQGNEIQRLIEGNAGLCNDDDSRRIVFRVKVVAPEAAK